MAGEDPIIDDRVDMGAYEWNTFVGMNEPILKVPNLIVQAYPNPFSSSTTISYNLQQHTTVQIAIFNHLGKHLPSSSKANPQDSSKSPGTLQTNHRGCITSEC